MCVLYHISDACADEHAPFVSTLRTAMLKIGRSVLRERNRLLERGRHLVSKLFDSFLSRIENVHDVVQIRDEFLVSIDRMIAPRLVLVAVIGIHEDVVN